MQLSVVIAAGGGAEPVRRCLRSLEEAGARERCEVIVAGAAAEGLEPWVRGLPFPAETSYAALRAAGLAAAGSPRVAMLSEDYTVDGRWLARALAESNADVAAGVTLPPPGASVAAKAAWLWEYAHLVPPLSPGPLGRGEAILAPGGNAVYRRERVDPEILRAAGHELEYHRQLYDGGLRFERDSAMAAVYHPPSLGEFLRDRARWSANWAQPKAKGLGGAARWIAAASRAALPPLLLGRFALRVAGKPQSWASAAAGLPLFAAFACAQAYGEASAYLDG